MLANQSYTLQQSRSQSDHEFVWAARLTDGTVIHEQPGVSSDELPRELVAQIEYVPRIPGLPRLVCAVDLTAGERFVRYWTTLWKNRHSTQRLYVLGVERGGRHSLLAYYPRANKAIFAAERPFQAPWQPLAFHCVPSGAILTGGPGTRGMGWRYDGFGGELRIDSGSLVFRAVS